MNAGDGAVTAARTRADGNTHNKLTQEKWIFDGLQRDAFGLLLMLLYTNACYNLGLATTKPPRAMLHKVRHAVSLRRALRALSTSWRGLTELDRAVSCRDQAWPCRVVIKHAIDHALPLT